MRASILSTLILCNTLTSYAQCYEVHQRPYAPDPFIGATEYQLMDDQFTDTVEIGFPFCFFGEVVTKCLISSNGFITFNLDSANGYSPYSITSPIPNTNDPRTFFSVMGPWQDLAPYSGGVVSSETYGVAPYRRFVISFDTVPIHDCTGGLFMGPLRISKSQIILYESLNVIDINIAEKEVCYGSNFGSAIEGIMNQVGTEAYVVPGRNYPGQWTAQNDSYRFTPTCYCPSDSMAAYGVVPGKVFWDENSDCQLNQGEALLPGIRIDVQPNNGVIWTNQNGEFVVALDPGNYTFEHSSQNPWFYINDCQPNGIPVTVVEDSNAVDVCFADSIVPVVDLSTTIATNQINACFINSQFVTVCNEGTIPATDVEVTVQIPSFTGTSNSQFTATSDSTWSLTIPILSAGECNSYLFSGIAACDSSMIGQVACLSVELGNTPNDIDLSNNQMSFCDSVGASYDPNDIRVLSQNQSEGWRHQEYIDDDDEMTYMVRFQNTGTGPAFNVIVHNPLSGYLDHQSIELIAASHDFYAQMIDGELRVHFLGIELPDSASDPLGSQGYFIYKVNQPYGNPLGTIIENQAEIYFDFNAPVATNTTENEILLLTGVYNDNVGEITFYPNPTTGEVLISNSNPNNPVESVYVLDLQGRLLISENRSGISQIDMSNLRQGIYLIRIETERGTVVKRVVKN